MIEKVPEEEYEKYIKNLQNKDIMSMDYDELTDLADHKIADACDKQDWGKLKTGLRLLSLGLNHTEAKAQASKAILLKLGRGKDVQEHTD